MKNNIYRRFLFYDFIYQFRVHFHLKKDMQSDTPVYFTWEDSMYSEFMIALLQSLEPRFYSAQEYIFEEDDEVNE